MEGYSESNFQGAVNNISNGKKIVLECEQLYVKAYCHGEALHRMSAFHTFCSAWPYAVSFTASQYI
jgi:hypothetical protein